MYNITIKYEENQNEIRKKNNENMGPKSFFCVDGN